MITCRVCGTEHPDSKVRCDGQLPNGDRCGKDLTNTDTSTAGEQTPFGGGR